MIFSRIRQSGTRCLLVLGMACLVAGPAMAVAAGTGARAAGIVLPKQRVMAPTFTLPELAELPVSLDEYRGRVVLVHFWATFCTPCMHEMPQLESLWQRYRDDGLVVLGIAADRGSAAVVRKFAARAGVSFPVLLDQDGEVRNRYEVMALPTSYVIGRDGRISARMIGSQEWGSEGTREYIESLL